MINIFKYDKTYNSFGIIEIETDNSIRALIGNYYFCWHILYIRINKWWRW